MPTQKQLISETVKCPQCGFEGELDDFDCGGFPDGVVICLNSYQACYINWIRKHRPKRQPHGETIGCGTPFCVDSGKPWEPTDEELEEEC